MRVSVRTSDFSDDLTCRWDCLPTNLDIGRIWFPLRGLIRAIFPDLKFDCRLGRRNPKSMLPWNLSDLNEQRLTEVVTNGREESQTLEYKRSMPFGTWEERLKVLKAVSAFANTFGGDLVIGVDAADGIPQLPIVGIPLAEIDCLKLAFESVTRDSLEPSLPAGTVALKSIAVGREGQAVLVARIAQSWLAPHRIGRQGNRDFWTRTNAGKEPMTISQ